MSAAEQTVVVEIARGLVRDFPATSRAEVDLAVREGHAWFRVESASGFRPADYARGTRGLFDREFRSRGLAAMVVSDHEFGSQLVQTEVEWRGVFGLEPVADHSEQGRAVRSGLLTVKVDTRCVLVVNGARGRRRRRRRR